MNIFKTRKKPTQNSQKSYTVNNIENLTHLKDINLFENMNKQPVIQFYYLSVMEDKFFCETSFIPSLKA